MTIIGDEFEDELPDPHLSEQDQGIVDAFSYSDELVLTTEDIAQYVDLSNRQIRRRVKALAEDGPLGTRKVGGTRISWLDEDVKEPITVRYPLLDYILNRNSGIFALIGLSAGVIAVQILLVAAVVIGFHIPISFARPVDILLTGTIIAVGSSMFIIVAALSASIEWTFRHYGMDVEEKIEEWRG